MSIILIRGVSIRNYMSKPWFLKIALEGEPSPLRGMIDRVLDKDASTSVERENQSSNEGTAPPRSSRGNEPARL